MKFWSSILIFQLLFMMAEPVLAKQFSSGKDAHKCCQRSEKPAQKDCCENGACSYFSCVCCVVGVENNIEKNGLSGHIFAIQEFTFTSEKFLAEFHADCFHPPQIV